MYFQKSCDLAAEIFDNLRHSMISPDDFQKKADDFYDAFTKAGFKENVTPYIHGNLLLCNSFCLFSV